MRRITIVPIAAILAAALVPPAEAANPGRLVAAQRALDRAVYAATPDGLVRVRVEFEAMSAAEPKSAPLHYWVALADWRLVSRLSRDRKTAERYCKDGLSHAAQALKSDPAFAEAMALKASLQGLSLQFDPSRMMTLGQEMETALLRATSLAPKNPRVRLLDGINTLHKPTFVGGGPERALAKLKEAIGLFAAETVPDSTAPAWGREDALIWAGQSAMKLKDHAAARAFYAQALELDPQNGWVRGTLLPEAEKAASSAAPGDSSGAGKKP